MKRFQELDAQVEAWAEQKSPGVTNRIARLAWWLVAVAAITSLALVILKSKGLA